MALLDIRQRTGYLFVALTIGHIVLISAQVNTARGVPILEAVTFGAFAEVQRVASSAIGGVRTSWADYVALQDVRSENARLSGWVYVDVRGRDLRSAVHDMQAAVGREVAMPAGYALSWSGQFEYLERATERMKVVVPATLAVIFMLLYLLFRSAIDAALVMAAVPFSLVGGFWLVWLLGHSVSVATAVPHSREPRKSAQCISRTPPSRAPGVVASSSNVFGRPHDAWIVTPSARQRSGAASRAAGTWAAPRSSSYITAGVSGVPCSSASRTVPDVEQIASACSPERSTVSAT